MKMESPIEKRALPCISMAMEPLPFGQSHWDYLAVEIQERILDLAAKNLHHVRMLLVCRSIKEHMHWKNDCLFKKTFSQRCEKCQKIFSPELSMPRHRAICEGQQIYKEFMQMVEEDTLGYRSFDEGFEDRYGYSFFEFASLGEAEGEEGH